MDFSIIVEKTLAHFTTPKGWFKKLSIFRNRVFPKSYARLVWGCTTFCSIFCMPKPLPNVGVLLACFLTDAQIANS